MTPQTYTVWQCPSCGWARNEQHLLPALRDAEVKPCPDCGAAELVREVRLMSNSYRYWGEDFGHWRCPNGHEMHMDEWLHVWHKTKVCPWCEAATGLPVALSPYWQGKKVARWWDKGDGITIVTTQNIRRNIRPATQLEPQPVVAYTPPVKTSPFTPKTSVRLKRDRRIYEPVPVTWDTSGRPPKTSS